MKKFLLPIFIFTVVAGCSNLEDAELSERKTFIKFFNGAYTLSATSVESIPGGYVILGNMSVNNNLTVTIVIETDENGNQIGEPHRIPGGTGKAIKPFINGSGQVTGYVIVGDSIKIDPFAEQAANTEIASLRVVQLNSTFGVVKTYFRSDRRPLSQSHPIKQDFFGQTLTITEDGKVFVLGGVKDGVVGQQTAPQKTLLMEFNSALDSVWSIEYDINDRTYQNAKSLIYNNEKKEIIWSTALAIDQGGFNASYVGIPVVEQQSIFVSYSVIGQTTTQLFVPKDITAGAYGYAITGTYSIETNGSKSNLFFLRAYPSGVIMPESIRYFDGRSGITPLENQNQSAVQDGGETIAATKDKGYIIAGYTELSSGNGKDIWLIKMDFAGEAVWQKTIGGAGDQVPSAIRELPSGEILICGTNTVGGFESIFLIKTNSKGEITK